MRKFSIFWFILGRSILLRWRVLLLCTLVIFQTGCTLSAHTFSSLLPVRSKIQIDSELTPPHVNSSNESGITLAGECPAGATHVQVGIPFVQELLCEDGRFQGILDFNSLPDGPFLITLTPNVGEDVTWEINKDTVAPSLSITGLANYINGDNASSFMISGACSESGLYVFVKVGLVEIPVVCIDGGFSGAFDFSSVPDADINLQARHQDLSGNSVIVSDLRPKDTVAPGVAVLTNLPVGPTPQIVLDVVVGGVDVVEYAYKLGPSSVIDCVISSGYGDFRDVANYIVEDISGLYDGSLRLCVWTKDIAGNRQSLSSATQYEWVKDSTVALATLSAFNPVGNISNEIADRTVTVGGINISHYKAVTLFNQLDCSSVDFSGAAETPVSSDFTFSVGSDGVYIVCVIGKNIVNNWQSIHAATASDLLIIDSIKPSLTLSSMAPGIFNTSSISLTATFSEAVTDFVQSDVTVSNGTLSEFTGSGAAYTFTLTPSSEGPVTVAVGAGVAQDAATNLNLAASTLSWIYDSIAPTVTLSGGSVNINGVFTATLTFSEAVTGVALGDFVATNAILTGLSGGPSVYTVTVTPTVDGSVSLQYQAHQAQDAGGNSNTASNALGFTYDSIAPTLSLSSLAGDPFKDSSFDVTATFSESVTGFSLSDIVVTNGTASTLSGSGTTYTWTITPSTQGLVTVAVGAGVATDTAGNGNSAAANLTRTFDNVGPSVILSSAAASSFNASTISVTTTFSESVTDFALSDIVVTNGTVSDLVGSGAIYTFTITPSAQGLVTVAVGAGVATDAAGNSNTVATNLTRTYDSVGPSVTLSSAAASLFNTSTISVTATFSESVTGFALSDIVVTNGTASALSGSGTTYTFTITPAAQGLVTVAVGAGVATDAAGNGNTSTTNLNKTYDSVAPTITGLTNDAVWAKSKTWNWSCGESCTYRHAIDTNASTTPTGTFDGTTAATQSSGTGTYYIHVQAQDSAGNTSIVHVSALIDNTNPNPASLIADGITINSLTQSPTITFTSGADSHSGIQKHQLRVLRVSDSFVMKDWHDFTSGNPAMGLSLATDTAYKVEVRAIDNVDLSSTSVASDGWIADTSPPSAPAGLSTGVVPYALTSSPPLAWSAASDGSGVGVSHYQAIIYRTSDNVAMSAWTTLTSGGSISGLSLVGGVQYYFKVRAVDVATNTGAESVASGSWTASSAYSFSYTISSNTQYFNVKAAAISAGWNQVAPLVATITVNANVYVWSDSTSLPAFDTGSGFPVGSTITLINNGYIIGKGGQGGENSAGGAGGSAMSLSYPVTINSSAGYIAGGGGGGGGSLNGSGGGGAGGGAGGAHSGYAGGGGGSLGSVGGGGLFSTYYGSEAEHGCGCSWTTYVGAGGGGGRRLPGSGGNGGSAAAGGYGGGAGGGGGGYYDDYNWSTTSIVGGSGGSAGNSGTSSAGSGYGGGGGGGWGAAGGASGTGKVGGAGGKAINTNGNVVTWSGGSQPSTVFGPVN